MQGVPLRLEIGPQDVQKKQVLAVRRDIGEKSPIAIADLTTGVSKTLDTIQADMYKRAYDTMQDRLRVVLRWEDVVPTLDDKCVVVIPWCEQEACEDDIKERSGKLYVTTAASFDTFFDQSFLGPSRLMNVLHLLAPNRWQFRLTRRDGAS